MLYIAMDFSIVIPMHDEAEALASLLPALDRTYEAMAPARCFEAILVDDGSTDHSFEIAWDWAERARFPVKVFRQNPCEGLGGALRTGFRFALGRAVITYDADMSYPLADLGKLMDKLDEGHDIVTASPFHPEGGVRDVAPERLRISRLAHLAYRLRLPRKLRGITCVTCGFRAYRREILETIAHRHDGFLATAELLVRGLRAGLRVAEVPSWLAPRVAGRSKMKVLRTALQHLRFLITLR